MSLILQQFNWANLLKTVCFAILVLFGGKLVSGRRRIRAHKHLPYPPGPKPRFWTGNLLDIPHAKAWITYSNWSKEFHSSILHLGVLGEHLLILNHLDDARELLERRSINSDRPQIAMVSLMGWAAHVMTFIPYGSRWRHHRRIFQQNFRRNATVKFNPIQKKRTHKLLRDVLANPGVYDEHIKDAMTAISMSVAYGHEITSAANDSIVTLAEDSISLLVKYIFSGSAFVNIFPILRFIPSWLPGAKFKRDAERGAELTEKMHEVPIKMVKDQMALGSAQPSLASRLLELNAEISDPRARLYDETLLKGVALTVHAAASETSASAARTFFYVMAKFTEVQKKGQQEIDGLLHNARLPEFCDRPSLLYVEAIYREVLRWMPPLPISVPHRSTEDDIYQGYFIPKGICRRFIKIQTNDAATHGTTILANIWAMTRNETTYPEPEMFRPERFIDENGQLNGDESGLAFGFGKRVCAGRHMASDTLWMAIVSTLAVFDIRKAKDLSGNELHIDDSYFDDVLVLQKKPIKCSILPRSPMAQKLIEDTKEF